MQRTSILFILMSLMACDMALQMQDIHTLADVEHWEITSREATDLGTSLILNLHVAAWLKRRNTAAQNLSTVIRSR